jgi:hypothetical protein
VFPKLSRAVVGRTLDASALALFGMFLWQVFFVPGGPLDALALVAALPAVVAAK